MKPMMLGVLAARGYIGCWWGRGSHTSRGKPNAITALHHWRELVHPLLAFGVWAAFAWLLVRRVGSDLAQQTPT